MLDAFRAFDSSGSGQLSCTELYSGVLWLGLPLTVPQVHDMVRTIDSDSDGFVSAFDFKRAFHVEGDEEDVLREAADTDLSKRDAIIIPQHEIEELHRDAGTGGEEELETPDDVVQQFKVLSIDVGGFDEVWTSEGTMARSEVSVWAPKGADEDGFGADKARICVGHYATQGLEKPSTGQMVMVQDTSVGLMRFSSDFMRSVVLKYLPHPKRFRQIWNKQKGDKKLYCWLPVPPSPAFVALGHICTCTDEPPDLCRPLTQ